MGMVRSYIDYRIRAKSRHGVHSPFVYRIADEVVRANGANGAKAIEALRKTLKHDKRPLQLRDLGAGSRTASGLQRTIGEIARTSASRPGDAAFLQRLIDHLHLGHVLELGTNLGLTTAYLASARCQPKVVGIEGDPALAALTRAHLAHLGLAADILTGSFDDKLDEALTKLGPLELAYIDGHHRHAATLRYFERLSACAQPHTVIAIGDIHWSEEMEAAWRDIKAHESTQVTVDLFYLGLVFFRKGQAPEHFTLRHP